MQSLRLFPYALGMPLSAISISRLMTCDIELQKVVKAVAEDFPVMVLCGYRGRIEQEAAFRAGSSKLHWPESRHNSYPSTAVDLAPLPIDWLNLDRFKELAAAIMAKADELGVELEWGGDWDSFVDRPHFQLKKQKASPDGVA